MKRSNFFGGRRALLGAAAAAVLTLGACDGDPADPYVVEGEGSVSGFLFYDADRDGVFDPIAGDYVLSGVPVNLYERDTNDVIPGTEVTTDAQGRFSITAVEVGTHSLFVDLDENVGTVCQNPMPVSVRLNEVTAVSVTGQESCLITIEEAREQPIDAPVTVRGVVTVGSGDVSGSYFWIQDETAGIKIFMPASAQVGQYVEVSGLREDAFGEKEVSRGTVTVLGTAPVPDPVIITGAELLSSDYQGSLVTVEGVEVTAIAVGVGGGDNITVRAPDGEVFLIRADYDTGVTQGTAFTVGETYNVSGVVSPFGGAEQIYVRGDSDIELVP